MWAVCAARAGIVVKNIGVSNVGRLAVTCFDKVMSKCGLLCVNAALVY